MSHRLNPQTANRKQADDRLSVEEIEGYLDPAVPKTYVRVYETLASTNDTAKEQAAAGAPAGTVVIAEQQTAGKGRMGRSFYSPPAGGVYLSMVLRPGLALSRLPLLTTGAAVAGARAIEQVCGRRVAIKWINDLYLRGKKIAGILTEASAASEIAGFVVVGIGVNVSKSAGGFPSDLEEKAGCLCEEGESLSRNRLAAALISQIRMMAMELEMQSAYAVRAIIDEARAKSNVLGREVLVEGRGELLKGRAVDITEQGFLILEDETGARHTISSGEVSIRHVP